MNRRTRALALSLPGLAAGVGLAALHRADRRGVHADPEHAFLSAPPEGRPRAIVAKDGTRLHAEVFGPEDAPTIVLLHGWTCTLQMWAYQLRDLARTHRVVAMDLRGHGRSDIPDSGDWSIETFADDLDALLEQAVPAGERPVVAGHSMGAMTIACWAGRHPARERLGGAVLVCTGLSDLIAESLIVRTPKRFEHPIGAAVLSSRAPLPVSASPLSYRAIRYITLGPDASPALVEFVERITLRTRREARGRVGGTLSRLALLESVHRLDVPTIVLYGTHDRLTPPPHAERIAAELPQLVELVRLERVGHMGLVEAPDAVTGAIARLAVATPVAA